MTQRSLKTISALASLALVAGIMVGGAADAGAKKKKKKGVTCDAFTPVEPKSNSGETAEALEAEVVKVTNASTEEKPLVVEYEHGPALWETATQTPIHEDTVFFNIQAAPKSPTTGVYARIEWSSPSADDIDLYMYDAAGDEVAVSGAFNAAPVGPFESNGGNGFEFIEGHPANQCDGFTLESRAFATEGEAMSLKLWLGEVVEAE